jgi:uncharacterized cupredoxin-like copper-binding protein
VVQHRHRTIWVATIAAALSLMVAACGGGGGSTVDVTVQEFEVAPDDSSVDSGEVTFDVTNKGPDDMHEFVVIKTDLAPDALPTDENGAVDENGAGIEVVDEVEEFAVGETKTLKVDLAAGKYVLICNVFDQEENEAHYSKGMRAAFTVTG